MAIKKSDVYSSLWASCDENSVGVHRTHACTPPSEDGMGTDWPWDEALDALIAAPAQHRLVFENAHVRVVDTRIAPGERTPVHTHCWPASHYVVSWSDFVRRDADGSVLVDTRATGRAGPAPEALWGDALAPHSLENVGPAPLHIISTEVKPAASAA